MYTLRFLCCCCCRKKTVFCFILFFGHGGQAEYVREWLMKAGLEKESQDLDLLFYPARYHAAFGSIFPMGDLSALVCVVPPVFSGDHYMKKMFFTRYEKSIVNVVTRVVFC